MLSPPKLQTYRRASGHNRLYITLAPPEDGDQEAEIRRLEALGAKVVTVRVDGVDRSIMEDPEGPRELKVIGPVPGVPYLRTARRDLPISSGSVTNP